MGKMKIIDSNNYLLFFKAWVHMRVRNMYPCVGTGILLIISK